MPEKDQQETRSYRDPLGDAGFTSLLEPPDRPKPPAEPIEDPPDKPDYPAVADVYQGFYQRFEPQGEAGRRFLIGVEGVIGMPVASRAISGGRELLDLGGQTVATAFGPRLAELNEYEQAGWLVECRLALSVYLPDTESFIGEAAWMAYDPRQSGADAIFAVFIENITSRIAEGSHPRLSLDQDQFEQVMESTGHWFLTKSEPLADLPKGSLIHKRRRNWADYLAQAAAAHRLGCNIAAWLFLAAIAGTVIFLVFVLPRL